MKAFSWSSLSQLQLFAADSILLQNFDQRAIRLCTVSSRAPLVGIEYNEDRLNDSESKPQGLGWTLHLCIQCPAGGIRIDCGD
jgi:hypothetical protein